MPAAGHSGDEQLLAEAAAFPDLPALPDCTSAALAALSRARGVDFATATLYDRLIRTPEHRDFLMRVRASRAQGIVRRPRLAIVPGAFYREHKNTGADGSRISNIAKELGFQVDCIPVESFGSIAVNARQIVGWLGEHSSESLVLVSLSKGSSDVKMALASAGASDLFRNVTAWISLSGLTEGTPLVAWLRRQRLRRLGVCLLLWMRGQRYSVVEELRHDCNGPLDWWPALPPHLRVVHVIGFPLRHHLSHRFAFRGYERLASLGPNDGGGFLLGEVTRLPGIVFPIWGADHYLQPHWDTTSLLRAVLAESVAASEPCQANLSAHQPSTAPASKSSA